MPFLILSKVEVDVAKSELTWKAYTFVEGLSTIKKVQIIDPKKFEIERLLVPDLVICYSKDI